MVDDSRAERLWAGDFKCDMFKSWCSRDRGWPKVEEVLVMYGSSSSSLSQCESCPCPSCGVGLV